MIYIIASWSKSQFPLLLSSEQHQKCGCMAHWTVNHNVFYYSLRLSFFKIVRVLSSYMHFFLTLGGDIQPKVNMD